MQEHMLLHSSTKCHINTVGTCYSVWLTVWYTGSHAPAYQYQVSHKYSCFSWWWAHSLPKHVEKRNERTKKNCAPTWLYLQDMTGGCYMLLAHNHYWKPQHYNRHVCGTSCGCKHRFLCISFVWKICPTTIRHWKAFSSRIIARFIGQCWYWTHSPFQCDR